MRLVTDDSGGAYVGLGGGHRLDFILGDCIRLAIVVHNRSWYRNQDKLGDGLPASLLVAAWGIAMIAMTQAWCRTGSDVDDRKVCGEWMGR